MKHKLISFVHACQMSIQTILTHVQIRHVYWIYFKIKKIKEQIYYKRKLVTNNYGQICQSFQLLHMAYHCHTHSPEYYIIKSQEFR